MKNFIPLLISATLVNSGQGALLFTGVIDGDLSGGNPKAVLLTATCDIVDLSIYGIGSANNGGGSDGQEFTLSGSVNAGDVIVIASNVTNQQFFDDNYLGVTSFVGGAANINGDDAIELFESGIVIDTYGDINTLGDGEDWDYSDGYAVRTGGTAGSFEQANYDSVFQGLSGLDEAGHVSALAGAFNLTPVPEPSSTILGGISALMLIRRRR